MSGYNSNKLCPKNHQGVGGRVRTCGETSELNKRVVTLQNQITNYFTSSDPHHDMLGGGCQVRVVIENMMGRMENLRTLISGFLGLVILVRWALVTMFLS